MPYQFPLSCLWWHCGWTACVLLFLCFQVIMLTKMSSSKNNPPKPTNQQTNKPTTPPQKQKKQGVKFFQRIDSKSCRILDLHLHSWDPFGGIPISRAHRNLPLPKKNCVIVLCMNPPTAIANHPASVENGLQDEDISRVNCVFFLCLPVESGKKGKKCR